MVRSDLVFENVWEINGEYLEFERITSEIGKIGGYAYFDSGYSLINPPDIFNDIQNTNLIVESNKKVHSRSDC